MTELPSPLQLDDYRLVLAHLEAAEEKPEAATQTIETQLTRGGHKDDPLRWRVDLEVRFGKAGDEITGDQAAAVHDTHSKGMKSKTRNEYRNRQSHIYKFWETEYPIYYKEGS